MLKLQNVSKTFFPGSANENKALEEIWLDVKKGDFITVIGSNGAGKSTLFNIIAGSLKTSSGKIIFENKDITSAPEYVRARRMGRIFQNPLLGTSGSMSLEENMTICRKKGFKPLKISLNEKLRAEFRRELSRLNMGLENRLKDRVGLFSGGQRQAVTLLTTAMSRPKLVLLDEHTAALDPDNSERVMELTLKFQEEYGLTMMMITHNMNHAIKYGNRLLMMDGGKIIFEAAGEEKEKLTLQKLMDKFKAVRKDGLADDRILLS